MRKASLSTYLPVETEPGLTEYIPAIALMCERCKERFAIGDSIRVTVTGLAHVVECGDYHERKGSEIPRAMLENLHFLGDQRTINFMRYERWGV